MLMGLHLSYSWQTLSREVLSTFDKVSEFFLMFFYHSISPHSPWWMQSRKGWNKMSRNAKLLTSLCLCPNRFIVQCHTIRSESEHVCAVYLVRMAASFPLRCLPHCRCFTVQREQQSGLTQPRWMEFLFFRPWHTIKTWENEIVIFKSQCHGSQSKGQL